ncbi:MAG: alpha/beta fold hydrolase [Acidobacteria bacterium]|nr:alpha/beta fold hydrolase [Acidobacteriota bacterium]
MTKKLISIALAIFFFCLSSNATELKFDDSGYIDVSGCKLFYEKTGTGTPIILVHDGLLHRETWDHQVPELAKRFMVIRYDRRGYGKSDIPKTKYSNTADLLAVYNHFNLKESAILMGCSAGSRIVMDFTLEHPDKVKAIILIGPVVSGFTSTSHMSNRGGHLTKEIFNDHDRFLKYWFNVDPYNTSPKNKEARAEADRLLQANPQNLDFEKNYLSLPPARPALKNLGEIKVPALIIGGADDMPDVHAHIGAINAGIENSFREVVPDSGHLVHMEKPDVFNHLLFNFLNEINFLDDVAKNGFETASNNYIKGLEIDRDSVLVGESRINQLGYQYLNKGDVAAAIYLLRMNVAAYPESSNTYDSLAEAYNADKQYDLAISFYKKVLELNPDNAHAKRQIEIIESEMKK